LTDSAARVIYESANYQVAMLPGSSRWKVNAYLLTARQAGISVVIDPGGDPAVLIPALHGLRSDISYVLLTHGHFDHMTAAAAVTAEFSIPCLIHPADARLLRHAPFYAISFDKEQLTVPSAVLCLDAQGAPDLSAAGIKVLAAPGHTPGGVFYVVGQLVFSGDTLLRELVGRTDQPGGNRADLTASIESLLGSMPDEAVILPGHGRPWTIGAARSWWRQVEAEPPAHIEFI
jgi:glyoxylase-like metal-dependent hydrolase (beta-lactamase superfamily II)